MSRIDILRWYRLTPECVFKDLVGLFCRFPKDLPVSKQHALARAAQACGQRYSVFTKRYNAIFVTAIMINDQAVVYDAGLGHNRSLL